LREIRKIEIQPKSEVYLVGEHLEWLVRADAQPARKRLTSNRKSK
jgi:hypothetical protein